MAIPLKNMLDQVLGSQDTWQLQLLNQWETIVGSLKTKVHLLRVQDDTLVLGVPDACWMQELYLLSSMLIARINKHLDQPRIKNLRLKAIGISKFKAEKKKQKLVYQEIKPRSLTTEEQRILQQITDLELRDALQKFLFRCNHTH